MRTPKEDFKGKDCFPLSAYGGFSAEGKGQRPRGAIGENHKGFPLWSEWTVA